LVNQIRGLLAEFGIILPQHVAQLRRGLPEILENAESGLSGFGRQLFAGLYEELVDLEKKIEAADGSIERAFRSSESCQRIAAVEGVGSVIATAIVAAISDGKSLCKRQAVCSLAGPCTAAELERRQDQVDGHQ
jgi:transposase